MNSNSHKEKIIFGNPKTLLKHNTLINRRIKLVSLKSNTNFQSNVPNSPLENPSSNHFLIDNKKDSNYQLPILDNKSKSVSKILPKIKSNKSNSRAKVNTKINPNINYNISLNKDEKIINNNKNYLNLNKIQNVMKIYSNPKKKIENKNKIELSKNNEIETDKSFDEINSKIEEILNFIDDDTTDEINEKIKELNQNNFGNSSINYYTQRSFIQDNNWLMNKENKNNNNNSIINQSCYITNRGNKFWNKRYGKKEEENIGEDNEFDYIPNTSMNYFIKNKKIFE